MLVAAHGALEVKRELVEDADLGIEDKSVDTREGNASGLESLHALSLDNAGLVHVDASLDGIQLHESAVSKVFVFDEVERRAVESVHVADGAEPLLDQPEVLALQGSAHRTAVVVAGDDDVLNEEVSDSVLEHGVGVEVGGGDLVADVAVHEHLAWTQADDLVGGHTAVSASDPEELGLLRTTHSLEVLRVLGLLVSDPLLVVLQDLSELLIFYGIFMS